MSVQTVYFLGAGATKDVAPEAPLNKDIVKNALSEFADAAEAKEIMCLIKTLYHGRKNPTIDNQIWNLMDFIIQQGRTGLPAYGLDRIEEIRESLLTLIIRLLELKLRNFNGETYSKFVNAIKGSRAAILSTNYDIVIDDALVMINSMNYSAKFRSHVKVDPGNMIYFSHGFRRATKDVSTQINHGQIELLKLHGSLNWLYCRKCDEVDLTVFEKGCVHALSGLYCCNDNCTTKYEPLLITPTMFKNYDNRFIKEVWKQSERRLIEADNLVFIGYALKEEDYQIRCLLMKAMLSKKTPYKKVVVIEKKATDVAEEKLLRKEVGRKYKELYGENVKFQAIGFSGFVNNITEFGLSIPVEQAVPDQSPETVTDREPWIDRDKTRDWLKDVPKDFLSSVRDRE